MRYLCFISVFVCSAALAENLDAQPTLSTNGSWVPVMLIIVAGMFLAAAVIGPIVRANMSEETPPADSHDSSHHHDTGGPAHH
jgi:hypothetical protein